MLQSALFQAHSSVNHSSCSGLLPGLLTLRLPLQNACCGGLFFSTHTLLNKHFDNDIIGIKKTMTFNNCDYEDNYKVVSKILHKDVLIHVSQRENIKNGK